MGAALEHDPHETTATAAVPVATEEGNFLDDVIRVLLNARRVLSASYCIGYFLPPESLDLIGAHDTLQVCKAGILTYWVYTHLQNLRTVVEPLSNGHVWNQAFCPL